MIKNFKENECRDSAVIFKSTFEKIKMLYTINPAQAGELAISAIELALTGDISSDDLYMVMFLQEIKVINERNKEKYDRRVEAQEQKKQEKVEELHLAEIAQMYLEGYTQKKIGDKLGVSQQTISSRLGLIRTEYKYLLDENFYKQNTSSTSKIQLVPVHDNDNVNDNDNYVETVRSVPYSIAGPCTQAYNSPCGEFEF